MSVYLYRKLLLANRKGVINYINGSYFKNTNASSNELGSKSV